MNQNPSENPLNKTNFDSTNIQPPDLQKIGKNKLDTKQILALVVLVLVVVPAVIINVYFFQQVKNGQSVTVEKDNEPFQTETSRLSEGEETINIKPGGKFILADGISNIHFNGGSENAVPTIIFDKNYSPQ